MSFFSVRPVLSGSLLALLATIIWSGNFVLARAMAEEVPPLTLSLLRWGTAFVILLPFGARNVWKARRCIASRLGYFIFTGLVGVTLFNSLIYIAGRTTPAMNMALLAASSPVFALLLSWLVKLGRPNLRHGLAVLCALTGALIIIARGDVHALLRLEFSTGDVWTLAGAVCFAAYSILVRWAPRELSPVGYLMTVVGFGVILLVPMVAVELASGAHVAWSPLLALQVLHLGLGMSVVAFLCWNAAIARIGAASASMIYYSLPVLSAVQAMWLLGERLTGAFLVGAAFVLCGILLGRPISRPAGGKPVR